MSDDSSGVRWQRSPFVAFVDDGERIVLIDLREPISARPRLLSGSAALIWRAINGARSTRQIAALMEATLGNSPGTSTTDIHAFVEHLHHNQWAVPAQPATN